MQVTFGRRSRLITLGAGLLTAAAVAVSASGPALADTTDTGGSGVLSVPVTVLVALAHSNIIVLPGDPISSSVGATGLDAFTMPVTGGNGEVSNFFGAVNYGGTLVFVNGANGKNVAITGIELNFFTGALTGVLPGATKHTALAYVGGDLSTSTGTGTETFSCDQLTMSGKAAKALNTGLGAKVFVRGVDIGSFTTTFDVTIT